MIMQNAKFMRYEKLFKTIVTIRWDACPSGASQVLSSEQRAGVLDEDEAPGPRQRRHYSSRRNQGRASFTCAEDKVAGLLVEAFRRG